MRRRPTAIRILRQTLRGTLRPTTATWPSVGPSVWSASDTVRSRMLRVLSRPAPPARDVQGWGKGPRPRRVPARRPTAASPATMATMTTVSSTCRRTNSATASRTTNGDGTTRTKRLDGTKSSDKDAVREPPRAPTGSTFSASVASGTCWGGSPPSYRHGIDGGGRPTLGLDAGIGDGRVAIAFAHIERLLGG